MPEDHFPESVAAHYDADVEAMFSEAVVASAVRRLAELAGSGSALEFGVGTGRLALPLSAAGVPLHGIDLSEAMLSRLRAKPGTAHIGVTVGDFASARAPGTYSLVYLAFNTIMNLTTQDGQVACFQNAARHLEPTGRFLIEVEVPDLQRLPAGEIYRPFDVGATHIGFDEYDVVSQRLISHHLHVREVGVDKSSIPFRYVWPSELDLMARLAGMTLEGRWSDWDGTAFTASSRKHISVWRKTSTASVLA